jgi:hypothetical protein
MRKRLPIGLELTLKLAESYLTEGVFRQILGRIHVTHKGKMYGRALGVECHPS